MTNPGEGEGAVLIIGAALRANGPDLSAMWTDLLARAVVDALKSSGLAIVPVEPTEAMVKAAGDRERKGERDKKSGIYGGIYRAMLLAAP